jgi:SAM-dependent methyltransferase
MIGSIIHIALEGARLNALIVASLELRMSGLLSSGPKSIEQIARQTKSSLRGCQAIADGMVALKLWKVAEDGMYSNSPAAEKWLVPGKPEYVGDEHPDLFRDWLPRYAKITDSVKSGEPVFDLNSKETLDFWAHLTPMLAAKGAPVAIQAIETLGIDSGGAVSLLDVGGGGSAMYARQLLTRNPQATATQIDWPHINAAARCSLDETGVADRFINRDGDFHDVPFGDAEFDVVVFSHIVHQESPESTAELVGRAARALKPGGRVLIVDWVVDDGRTGPASSLLFNSTMLMLSSSGKSYERQELTKIMSENGFSSPRFESAEDWATLVIGEKV